MNWTAYIRENLVGAWQILSGRPEGLNRLDTSIEGFWRSFAIVVVIAPIAFLTLVGEEVAPADSAAVVEPLTTAGVLLFAITVLVDWFAFPLVFALLAPSFGLGSRYIPFIVARNWASIYISAIVAIVHVLRIFGRCRPLCCPSPFSSFSGLRCGCLMSLCARRFPFRSRWRCRLSFWISS
jgi:hypothetical protein